MKYLPLFLILIACGHPEKQRPRIITIELPPEQKYPKVVYNICSNVWAVQVGVEYFGHYEYFGKLDKDTVSVPLGMEFQFPDSITAAKVYAGWLQRAEAANKIKDSIFNCRHNYQ